jgi:hypothetical protein
MVWRGWIVGALALLAAGTGTGYAAFGRDDTGTAGAQFLKLGIGARAAGMGDAYGAVADDATAIYWNPAGLGELSGTSISLMHALWLDDISFDWVSYAHRLGDSGTLGAAVQYLSYGSLQGYDETGLENGSFNPNDTACTLTYARNVLGLDLGVSAKVISSTIKEMGTAVAFDAGTMYRGMIMDNQVSFGAVVQNVGSGITYVDEESPLPFNIKLAGACTILNGWIAALDVNAPLDNSLYAGAGTEYSLRISDAVAAQGRLGYSTRSRDLGGITGLTCGVGLTCRGFGFDYAFVPYGDLGVTSRISFSMKFR